MNEPVRWRDQARDDLDELARLLPCIDDDVPSLRHRHRGRGVLTDDEIEHQAEAFFQLRAAARVYAGGRFRVSAAESPPGPSRLPIDVQAMQLRAKITAELHQLEYDVAIELHDASYEAVSSDLARVRRLRRWLRRLHVKPGLEERTGARVNTILTFARAALDPPAFSQLGECPWCGAESLEVDHDKETITCVNAACECSTADCKMCRPPDGKPRSLHVWRRGEWEALAQLCKAKDDEP